MLSPSDIRPAVREVLLFTGNSLASYQILERLPAELRDQIIAERGMPGAGQGSRYTAASLVTDAVEGLLPSMEAPYRVYLETGDMTFEVAGQIIKPGNNAIAFYKLPTPEASLINTPTVAAASEPQDVSQKTGVNSEAKSDGLTPKKQASKTEVWLGIACLACLLSFLAVLLVAAFYASNSTNSTASSHETTTKSYPELDTTPVAPASASETDVNLFITKDGFLASTDSENIDRAARYAVEKDNAALQTLINAGAVVPLRAGMRVHVVDHKGFLAPVVKVHELGTTTELWTFHEALKKP